MSPYTDSPTPPVPDDGRYVYQHVQVLRAVDGDTLLLRFPLPLDTWRDLDVRLLGINAPELHGVSHVAGQAAKAYLIGLLTGADDLTARTVRDGTDKFGRYLAQLWALKGGQWVNINAAMIAAGQAVPFMQ